MRKLAFVFAACSLLTGDAIAADNPLAMFEGLVGRTWTAEGKWGNGSAFKQVARFEYALNGTIVVVTSKGFVDREQTKFGDRNHGIRQFDAESGEVRFWEFDVFGGVTTGTVRSEGGKIYYEYEYGGSMITDLWERVDENTCRYVVGSYVNNKWEAKYLETTFVASADG